MATTYGEKGVSKKGKVRLEMIIDRTSRRLGGKGEIFIGKGYWETFGCRKWGVLFNMIPKVRVSNCFLGLFCKKSDSFLGSF